MRHSFFLVTLVVSAFFSCTQKKNADKKTVVSSDDSSRYTPKKYVELKHPDWSKKATIYQVNIRQYTPEGTFKAFEAHLPRLKELGVDILWLMPVQTIGVKNRKGKSGSPYSVKDYYAVNAEYGTMDDLKSLVKKIHAMGMHVILDWVANHSAWDNELTIQHPEWYTRTQEGKFEPTPWYDWEDIIDFDYNQPGIRKYMTEALKYWVKETDIDGYRCDVAGFIPVDFWDNVRSELDAIKPVFMLAEWESRDLHKKAFDMTYSWSLYDQMHAVTAEKKNIAGLVEYLAHDVNTFPKGAYRMTFTDNHDKNSWTGTPFTQFGKGLEACIVLTCTVNGMPLVYSGQEAGNDRQLAFFDKDSITWKRHPFFDLYKKMFALKKQHQSLWNGEAGGEMIRIFNDKPNQVISFSREKNGDKIIALFNFSDAPVKTILQSDYDAGNYTNVINDSSVVITAKQSVTLGAWKYLVLNKQ